MYMYMYVTNQTCKHVHACDCVDHAIDKIIIFTHSLTCTAYMYVNKKSPYNTVITQ